MKVTIDVPVGHHIIDATELLKTLKRFPAEEQTFKEAVNTIECFPLVYIPDVLSKYLLGGYTIFDTEHNLDEVLNHDIDLIQIHDLTDNLGYVGDIAWKDGKIVSLDGDTYIQDMKIKGYKTWDDGSMSILVYEW